MELDTAALAMGRLERALARIETAVARDTHAARPPLDVALRAEVAAAIAEIDMILQTAGDKTHG